MDICMCFQVSACFCRFPGCRKAYEEMLQDGYLKEKVCEEGQDSTGGAKRWCVATVVKPWDEALGAKRAKVMSGDNGMKGKVGEYVLDAD